MMPYLEYRMKLQPETETDNGFIKLSVLYVDCKGLSEWGCAGFCLQRPFGDVRDQKWDIL